MTSPTQLNGSSSGAPGRFARRRALEAKAARLERELLEMLSEYITCADQGRFPGGEFAHAWIQSLLRLHSRYLTVNMLLARLQRELAD